jgi:hypothetical protein
MSRNRTADPRLIVGPNGDRRGIDVAQKDNGDGSLPAGGNRYALLFASQTYDPQKDGRHWPDLANPESDVTAIGNLLRDDYGFIVNTFFEKSKLDISQVLHEWNDPKKYGYDSELLIFFAGHGYFDRAEHCGYVVARDSLFSAPSPVERNQSCLSLDDLSQKLNKIPCRHVFLILDTCFGGTVDYGVAMASTRGGDDIVTQIDRDEYIAEKMERKSRLFLASAGKASALDGPPGTHSPFAQRLLDFLGTNTNNGVVTAGRLYESISWLPNERPKFGALLGNDGGDFLFVRKGP